MANISPFKALHYNTETFPDATPVVIPPYDNIPKADESKYLNRSPYNFAHIILPKSENEQYDDTQKKLSHWKEQGILKTTPTACYFLYQQKFEISGKSYRRNTLMCTVELSEFSDKVVRPHENTFGKYKADRLNILRKTQCNLSHVFAMVQDKEGFLTETFEKWSFEKPFIKGKTDEGVEHTVWKVDGESNKQVAAFFADKPIYIVDGHHRYSSALMYAKELGILGQKGHPANQMLIAVANSEDPALIVFPTHRLITKGKLGKLKKEDLETHFYLKPYSQTELETFVTTVQKPPQFCLYFNEALYHCQPKDWKSATDINPESVRKLSVAWSDYKLLKDYCGVNDDNRTQMITYEKDAMTTYKNRFNYDLIIFHAPPAVQEVIEVSDSEGFMPQKSTFFYPKLAAGFIMRELI